MQPGVPSTPMSLPALPGTPELIDVATPALCYALGMTAAKAGTDGPPGRLVGIINELKARGVWNDLAASLGPEQRAALSLLAVADKGRLRASRT